MEKGFKIPVLDHGHVIYVDHMGSDQRIVEAARVSYAGESKGPEKDEGLLNYLWKNRHTSPFEMVKLTLQIKLPIFVMRQYVRHRMQNLNEVSARYTELPNEFYIPKSWRVQDDKNRQCSVDAGDWEPSIGEDFHCVPQTATMGLEEACHYCYDVYERMIAAGVAREMARMVLPINIYTECMVTWDLKNLLHFIGLRDDSHAQLEIMAYGRAISKVCEELFPWTMKAYKKHKFKLTSNA